MLVHYIVILHTLNIICYSDKDKSHRKITYVKLFKNDLQFVRALNNRNTNYAKLQYKIHETWKEDNFTQQILIVGQLTPKLFTIGHWPQLENIFLYIDLLFITYLFV